MLTSMLKIIFILATCIYNQMSLPVREEAEGPFPPYSVVYLQLICPPDNKCPCTKKAPQKTSLTFVRKKKQPPQVCSLSLFLSAPALSISSPPCVSPHNGDSA